MKTVAERVRETRARRRKGAVPIRVVLESNEIDFLIARGYPAKRQDKVSLAEAVSAYLSDSVLEGA